MARVGEDGLLIAGADLPAAGRAAHELGIVLHELSLRESSLEEAYVELTADGVEYAAADARPGRVAGHDRAPSTDEAQGDER